MWKFKQQKTFPCKQFTGMLDRTGDSYTLHRRNNGYWINITFGRPSKWWSHLGICSTNLGYDGHPNLTMVTANGHATLFSRWHGNFSLTTSLGSRHLSQQKMSWICCAAKWHVDVRGCGNISACMQKLKTWRDLAMWKFLTTKIFCYLVAQDKFHTVYNVRFCPHHKRTSPPLCCTI